MFTIIGGDGREYGPANVETIRGWISAGRANLDTKAKALGSDEWRRLGDFAEFTTLSSPFSVATPPPVPSDLAEREVRLFARLTDWSLRILLTLPGSLLMGFEAVRAIVTAVQTGNVDLDLFANERVRLGAWLLFVPMVVLGLVQIVLLSVRGQTIGKMIMRIHIVRADDGSPARFVRAWLLREFVPALVGFVPIIGPFLLSPVFTIVDWCFIFRDDRRCLHDLIAGTQVVKVPRPTTPAA